MKEMAVVGQWDARDDDVARCSSALAKLKVALQQFHPAFDQLFLARDRPSDPVISMPGTPDEIEAMVIHGQIRNDTDHEPMEDAGFFVAWNDNTRRFNRAEVILNCGGSYGSYVAVNMPEEVHMSGTSSRSVEHLLRAVVTYFEPDWAIVASPQSPMWPRAEDFNPAENAWMLYLRQSPPHVNRGIAEVPLAGGVLYRVTDDWYDEDRPEHRRRSGLLVDLLGREGNNQYFHRLT